MHFQVINDSYYSGILDKIDEYFPLFNSVFDKEDGIYPILGELGRFIMGKFNQEEIKIKTINFINEAIEQGGSETEDALVLQLFQQFYEDKTLSDEIRRLVNPKTLFIFDKYLEEFNK